MQFEIGQIAFFFLLLLLLFFSSLSPSAAHEVWYALAGSLSRHKPDASTHTAAKESSHSEKSARWNKRGTPKRSAGISGVIYESQTKTRRRVLKRRRSERMKEIALVGLRSDMAECKCTWLVQGWFLTVTLHCERCIDTFVKCLCNTFGFPLNKTSGFKTERKLQICHTWNRRLMFSPVSFYRFQEERAQPRPGRKKHPPVIFASLGLSAMWMQRMFGEFSNKHTFKMFETVIF